MLHQRKKALANQAPSTHDPIADTRSLKHDARDNGLMDANNDDRFSLPSWLPIAMRRRRMSSISRRWGGSEDLVTCSFRTT
jgi:hypothetical protein